MWLRKLVILALLLLAVCWGCASTPMTPEEQAAQAQRLQAMGVFLQGWAAYNQSLTPPLPRTPLTCHHFGDMTQCF